MIGAVLLVSAVLGVVWALGTVRARRARREAMAAAWDRELEAIERIAADPRWALIGVTYDEAAATLRSFASSPDALDDLIAELDPVTERQRSDQPESNIAHAPDTTTEATP